jgi:hypothetical protein
MRLAVQLGASQRGQLLGFFNGHGLGTLVEFGLSLETHFTTSPLAEQFRIVVVLFSTEGLEQFELFFVRLVDTSQSHGGGRLHVHQGSETSLVLDNHKGDSHFAAEGRQPHDKLEGINVVGDQHKLGFLFFHQRGNMLESVLDLMRGLATGIFSTSSSGFLDTLFLGGGSFRAVLVEQRKDGHGFVLANHLGELVDGRRDLESLVENRTLTLNADVTRPSHETRKIATGGANIVTDAKVARTGGKERVGHRLFRLGVALFGSFLGCLVIDRCTKGANTTSKILWSRDCTECHSKPSRLTYHG